MVRSRGALAASQQSLAAFYDASSPLIVENPTEIRASVVRRTHRLRAEGMSCEHVIVCVATELLETADVTFEARDIDELLRLALRWTIAAYYDHPSPGLADTPNAVWDRSEVTVARVPGRRWPPKRGSGDL